MAFAAGTGAPTHVPLDGLLNAFALADGEADSTADGADPAVTDALRRSLSAQHTIQDRHAALLDQPVLSLCIPSGCDSLFALSVRRQTGLSGTPEQIARQARSAFASGLRLHAGYEF